MDGGEAIVAKVPVVMAELWFKVVAISGAFGGLIKGGFSSGDR
jgi:hypothetical protein